MVMQHRAETCPVKGAKLRNAWRKTFEQILIGKPVRGEPPASGTLQSVKHPFRPRSVLQLLLRI